MRKAIASCEGIEESDVVVDYGAKTATVSLGEGDASAEDIVASVGKTRFKLSQ